MNLVNSTEPAPAAQTQASDEKSSETNFLWDRLRSDPGDRDAKETLVETYLYLVRAELARLSYHLPPHIDRQDLYSEGMVGLLSAVTRFDPEQGAPFEGFARKRIWGAMMDRVRTQDGVPRSALKADRKITRAIREFKNAHCRMPDESELAAHLKIECKDLHELERQAGLARIVSLDVKADPRDSTGTYADQLVDGSTLREFSLDRLANAETRSRMADALRLLSDRERAIVVLYYHQGVMIKEIALAMEVTESRVSQLHTRALLKLRAYLERGESASAGNRAISLGDDESEDE